MKKTKKPKLPPHRSEVIPVKTVKGANQNTERDYLQEAIQAKDVTWDPEIMDALFEQFGKEERDKRSGYELELFKKSLVLSGAYANYIKGCRLREQQQKEGKK